MKPKKPVESKPKSKSKKKSPVKGGKGSSSGVGYASSGYDGMYSGGPWAGMTIDEIEELEMDGLDFPPSFTSYATAMQMQFGVSDPLVAG